MKKPPKTASEKISGQVMPGDGRGTRLGTPTANLSTSTKSPLPANGTYACLAQIQGEEQVYQATMHVGPRPTFPGASASVEVHLLDFPYRHLYGETISCHHIHWLRPTEKFDTEAALIAALRQDAEHAKEILPSQTSLHD